jgi:hypothetical protein
MGRDGDTDPSGLAGFDQVDPLANLPTASGRFPQHQDVTPESAIAEVGK